jgi:hypothetical protein
MKKIIVTALLAFGALSFAQEKMENELKTPKKEHFQNGKRDEIRLK